MRNSASIRIALSGIALIILVGCGATSGDDEDQADVNLDEVLSDASAQLAETESMYFTLEVEGDTLIDPAGTLRLLNAEGVLQRPDRVEVTFQVRALGTATLSIRMITLGTDAWTTDPVTGNWITAPEEFGYNPAVLYDDQDGLGPVLDRIIDPEMEDTEEINGRECYRIVGTVDEDVIGPVTSNTMSGGDADLHVWIDVEDSRIHQVHLIENEAAETEAPATWIMELSQHGEQVTIEPPE